MLPKFHNPGASCVFSDSYIISATTENLIKLPLSLTTTRSQVHSTRGIGRAKGKLKAAKPQLSVWQLGGPNTEEEDDCYVWDSEQKKDERKMEREQYSAGDDIGAKRTATQTETSLELLQLFLFLISLSLSLDSGGFLKQKSRCRRDLEC